MRLEEQKLKVVVFGNEVEVNREDKVLPFLEDRLRLQGVRDFSLVIDGEQCEDSCDIPETFEDVSSMEIGKYVTVG